MPGVFLSYRRSDSAVWCKRLADHLSLRFGDDIVFRDVDDLQPGMRWRREIDAALRGSEVVLVLIGPQWFSARQRRRLADPKDVLRGEIAASLRSPRRKVVPVLLGGAVLPDADALPRPLRALCGWQACTLRERQWRRDVEELVEQLRQLVPGLGHITLVQIHQRLLTEQERYFTLLDVKPGRALVLARSTMRHLNRVCPRYPQDSDLQLVRGYTHKNIAMALQRLERNVEADQALGEADRTFRTATRERPRDAGAWNGLASVAALRGQLKQALRLVDKALKLAPLAGGTERPTAVAGRFGAALMRWVITASLNGGTARLPGYPSRATRKWHSGNHGAATGSARRTPLLERPAPKALRA